MTDFREFENILSTFYKRTDYGWRKRFGGYCYKYLQRNWGINEWKGPAAMGRGGNRGKVKNDVEFFFRKKKKGEGSIHRSISSWTVALLTMSDHEHGR